MEALNILMQIFLDFWLIVVPTAAVTWFAVTFIPVRETELASEYFKVTPLHEIVWHMGLYAFITTWVTIVLISVLVCLFLRCTPASPGLYSSRGLKGALLLYRLKKMNQIQRPVDLDHHRAVPARTRWCALPAPGCLGMRLHVQPRPGACQCRLPGVLVQWLFHEHARLWRRAHKASPARHARNFFSGNNCVAEYGQFPSNFLLGVSTPGNDIQFRRQMRSRLGEPITVAGNPPVKFASADFEAENEAQKLPSLPLFLARVFLNDIFSIGILRIANVLVYVVLYTSLLRLDGHLVVSAFIALILAEVILVVSCAAIKKLLVGSKWGSAHSTPFWSWRHFTYFFAQDCFFAWCKRPFEFLPGQCSRILSCGGWGVGSANGPS